MEDLTGKQLGHYQIVAPLGEGGMAAVYKAYQPAMDRYIALKVLPRHFASDPQFVARFQQEAKVLAKLQHPHILPVFDFGEADGYTYIVMPFIQSGTLADVMTGAALPWPQIRAVISQVGGALDYAHAHGLVHRDVKPSNVLLDESGNCLLADFGLAKIMEGSIHLTTSGAVIGTPAYMSPEQGLGQKLDARSDIYSLGVILYEMTTGRPPYTAETPMAVMIKHISDPLPPPSTINPTIPEAIERVILKALAKGPEDRFATAAEMVNALQTATSETTGQVEQIPAESGAIAPSVRLKTMATPVQPISEQTLEAVAAEAHPQPIVRPRATPLVWVAVFGGAMGLILLAVAVGFGGAFLAPDPTATSIAPAVAVQPTNTLLPSATPVPPTQTPVPTITPTLGIGSTQVSEKDGMVLVYVPTGEFLMGISNDDISWLTQLCPACDASSLRDQVPQRHIILDPYWIDQTEVTNAQFAEFVARTGYVTAAEKRGNSYVLNIARNEFEYQAEADWRHPRGIGSDVRGREDYPVTQMSWDDATAYCAWAGRRLPTEAEWEKAARGPQAWLFPWGQEAPSDERLNFNMTRSGPAPVGGYPSGASPYGVLDMAGNLWEWVADYYSEPYYRDAPDYNPIGPATGEGHTLRGGSWGSLYQTELFYVTTTFRLWNKPSIRSDVLGFRCVATNTEARPAPSSTPTVLDTPLVTAIDINSIANIRFADSFLNPPQGRVMLGGIPFELSDKVFSSQAGPTTKLPTEAQLNVSIPYPINLYVLVNTGDGFWRFEGKIIGKIELRFASGGLFAVDLVLGKNIREWQTGSQAAVTSATDVKEVWRGPITFATQYNAVLDLLTISIPQEYWSDTLVSIRFIDTSVDTVKSLDPGIGINGLSVEHRQIYSTSLPPATATPNCPQVVGPFASIWLQVRDNIGCASSQVFSGLVVEENFQFGKMIWRESVDTGQALVLYNNGSWKIYQHAPYVESSPEYPCTDTNTPPQSPPTPRRGFGAMWCDIPEIRAGLRNALDVERAFTGSMQQFENGFMLQTDYDAIFIFDTDGSWQRR